MNAGETMPRERPRRSMEVDALNSMLRVLEPLTSQERERCLAAACCIYNDLAARQALAGLVEQGPRWGERG